MSMKDLQQQVELPFLLTHWDSTYSTPPYPMVKQHFASINILCYRLNSQPQFSIHYCMDNSQGHTLMLEKQYTPFHLNFVPPPNKCNQMRLIVSWTP